MSIKAHPNIQAVALTTDILSSIEKNLRGKGLKYKREIVTDEKLKEILVNAVVDISTQIDYIVKESS